ncbi:DUF5333 domain-containing protein [Jannaschia sp. Os4]|uniref:DUF5333 domain-containing protein n=1 Tax=Jannaschia sp. Os4 TaxID=2807617 RepID=UPI0019394E76|nr:DUF5333 domain-containing protein [Jannaschia sp. Os4]MBM2576198.1 DUF5333 domain-containing protein [Jannaschia sp. Os4]
MTRPIAAAFLAAALAAPLPAAADLGDEPNVVEPLIAIGIAYEISKRCDSISARRVRGVTQLMSIRGRASDLGYSKSEIDAWIDDDAEKDRLEAVARERLAAMGAPEGNEAAHCEVGRAEIAKDSYIGSFLSD